MDWKPGADVAAGWDPDDRTIDLAVSRLRATERAVVLNPGGPGQQGVTMPRHVGESRAAGRGTRSLPIHEGRSPVARRSRCRPQPGVRRRRGGATASSARRRTRRARARCCWSGHTEEQATPHPWAERVREVIGGELLSVTDERHGSLKSSPCAEFAVRLFDTGRAEGGTCEVG